VSEREHPEPRDATDAVKDIARELADTAHRISALKAEANAYLTDPNYPALRHRLEDAHAAVEARRRVRLNESR
jgi:hypothetical protein